MSGPLVSVLINNYNYDRFLGRAIDSALTQTYSPIEVLVVDDGSADRSREVISRYGQRIVPVLKENGGQASAFNAGVSASRGDILCFLDSDDVFYPEKVARTVELFGKWGVNSKPLMLHHRLQVIDDTGTDIVGRISGKTHDSPMNWYAFAKRYGFLWYQTGPTTSISINRTMVDRLFPIPEKGVRVWGDDFIVFGASLLGDVYSISEILGAYRVHGNNNWTRSGQKKPPEFMNILETYLNEKLVKNGLSPVISFNNSIYAWSDLIIDKRWGKLAWQILKLSVKQHDKYTALWVYYTVVKIGHVIKTGLQQKLSYGR
jgi:glycosyltransferase involved in cell wall biosynthesis